MEIDFRKAKLEAVAGQMDQCPESNLPEVVLSGRSNVGKSSLFNALVDNKKLARVSSTPGKTRAVIFFNIDNKIRLTDLPGYGYAKIDQKRKAEFSALTDSYFTSGREFNLVLNLLDIRRDPTPEDAAMIDYMNQRGIRYFTVFTKCDKFSKAQLMRRLEELKELYDFAENADIFAVSSEKKLGLQELRNAIAKVLLE